VIDSKQQDKIQVRKDDFPGTGSQFSALFKRSVKMLLRNPVLTLMRLGQIIGMSFFFCSVFFQISDNEKDPLSVFNRNGGLFFVAVSAFIPAMMA